MRIASWNSNSIRARLDRLIEYLATRRPEVLCLQETKCQDAQFPYAELLAAGYGAIYHGQKTYNGVAILSGLPIEDPRPGLLDGAEDR